ncbi:MAG: hypothetical protein ACYSUQ_11325 [Planctomycetota bacterium]|jgi:hypothetical protein
MSLKAFHIFFVAVSALFSLGLGLWAIREYTTIGGAGNLVLGIAAFAACPVLAWYGRWFLRKLKGVSYI